MGLIFETTGLDMVLGFLLLIWMFYMYCKSSYLYWKNRSIAYEEPSFPFGTENDIVFFKKPFGHHIQSIYTKFKNEKVVGLFSLFSNTAPYLMIRDLELIKHIMTKSFHHFVDRGNIDPELMRPVQMNLTQMVGDSWKTMRNKLIPAFTSGKMKMMYCLMEACADEFVKALEAIAVKDGKFTVKDLIACFTTDVIASCAFGLQSNSIQNPDNEFRQNGNKIFAMPRVWDLIKLRIAMSAPTRLYKMIFNPISNDAEDFFLKIVGDTVAYREQSGTVRKDFIDIMINIKNNKIVNEDESEGTVNGHKYIPNTEPGLTLEEMTAQAMLFFAAGFETSASTLSFCLYEISVNPQVQAKMRKEIDEVLSKHDGKQNYQALQEMTYMEAVINETLRRYASLGVLFRQCTEDYKLPDLNLVIPKGMRVVIPVYAIHHDPQYYPDPYKFDPERFTDDKIKTKNNYTFIPFGEGPRMCIGNRFAMMQMKICLAMMLHKYELAVTEDTPIPPLDISRKHFITTPESPITLKISKLTN